MRVLQFVNYVFVATLIVLYLLLNDVSSQEHEFTKEQIENLREAFDEFGQGEGYIDSSALSVNFRSVGKTLKEDYLNSVIKEIDKNQNGRIEFDEFLLLNARLQADEDREKMNKLKDKFRSYDKDGKGYIEDSDLGEILRELDINMDDKEIEAIIAEADTDNSGNINLEEFMEIMKEM